MSVLTEDHIRCSNPRCTQGLGQSRPIGGFQFTTTARVTCDEYTGLRQATLSPYQAWTCEVCGAACAVPDSLAGEIDNEPERRQCNHDDPWACAYCGGANTEFPCIDDGHLVWIECQHCGKTNRLGVYVLIEVVSVEADEDEDEDAAEHDNSARPLTHIGALAGETISSAGRYDYTGTDAPPTTGTGCGDQCLDKGYGYGYGDGAGDGNGDGYGQYGDDNGGGYGDGNGCGDGDGDGCGYGNGDGDGDGDGNGCGYGLGCFACPYYEDTP